MADPIREGVTPHSEHPGRVRPTHPAAPDQVEGIGILYLTRTDGSLNSGHAQLVPGGMEELLDSKGIKGSVDGNHKVVYVVKLKDGSVREIVQGSTNSIWAQHQKDGPDADFFMELLRTASEGKTIALTVVDVKETGHKPGNVVKF